MLQKYSNKYIVVNILICRIKHLTELSIPSYLSKEELDAIKTKYALSQWTYYIALREYNLGLLNEYRAEYI
jgi:hypothetical protein